MGRSWGRGVRGMGNERGRWEYQSSLLYSLALELECLIRMGLGEVPGAAVERATRVGR